MTTTLAFARGGLQVRGWPPGLRPPFGLAVDGDCLRGPARLRRRVRDALLAAGAAWTDLVGEPGPLRSEAPAAKNAPAAAAAAAWRLGGGTGTVLGLPWPDEVALVRTCAGACEGGGNTLLVAADSGAAALWEGALAGAPVAVATAAAAAASMHWQGRRHELLVVALPERMPARDLAAVGDGSAALWRLALVQDLQAQELGEWTARFGTVCAAHRRGPGASCCELRVPLPAAARAAYDAAWAVFLGAFDRFAAGRAPAGFGVFVQAARGDPALRPGLLAWHAALAVAAWNEAKAGIVAELLQRHRGERVLVFTPDRQSAYELAVAHGIAPVTAELPARERRDLLHLFATGALRALAGPRLLDAGIAEAAADVGIVAGGGFGRAQRALRGARVRTGGIVYELAGLDTVEVGRGRRWRGTVADAPVGVHGDGG